jgi:ParB/RepB/Spo0J family partition protein
MQKYKKSSVSIIEVDIAELIRDSNFSRSHYDEGALKKLQQSIEEVGILQEPGVCRTVDGKLKVAWGHRRILAAERLGFKTISARMIKEGEPVSEVDIRKYNFIENNDRSQPSIVDAAKTFLEMHNDGLNAKEIAYQCRTDEEKVQTLLNMLSMINEQHLKALVRNDDSRKDEQKGMFTEAKLIQVLKCQKKYGLSKESTNGIVATIRENEMDTRAIKYVAKQMSTGVSLKESYKRCVEDAEEFCFFSTNFRAKKKAYKQFREKYTGMHPKDVIIKAIRDYDKGDEVAMDMMSDLKKLLSPRAKKKAT